MNIILAPNCKSITGSLGQGFGYHIEHRKNGFFAIRNSKGAIPPDGHWRFIIACAELAKMKLHITDIEVTIGELNDAVEEATNGRLKSPWGPRDLIINAADVLNLKTTFGI